MPNRRKESVKKDIQDLSSNNLDDNYKQFHGDGNKQIITGQGQVNSENVIKISSDNAVPSKSKKGRMFGSCNMCRSSKSTQVNTASLVSKNSIAENISETPGNSTKDDFQNKALPLSVYSGDHEIKKSPSTQGKVRADKAPIRRRTSESKLIQHIEVVENVRTELGNKKKPKQKKIRKDSLNTDEDIQLVYKNQIASLSTAVPETSSMKISMLRSQPTVEEESDLLENAEQERRRNKERVRAKNLTEIQPTANVKDKLDIAYLKAQKEIDKVLEPQGLNKKGLRRDKVINGKDNVETNEKDNEVKKGDITDSLENARQKMHKLLDDAFDILSERKPDIINKVQPSRERRNEVNSSNSHKSHFTRMEQIVQTDESMLSHKLHTPVQVHHSLTFSDPEKLITWNPYRAYDDTKPMSLNSSETNMSAIPVQQENLETSNLDQSVRPHSKYYATEPGEPIIIKTSSLQHDIPKGSQSKISTAKHCINENLPPHITSRNPVKRDMYSNNFYELSCFQETPTTSQVIKMEILNSTEPDNSSDDSSRVKSASKVNMKGHTEPQKIVDKNYDIVDVIKDSLQPGTSPQPLIDSLRKELQILTAKAQAATKKDH